MNYLKNSLFMLIFLGFGSSITAQTTLQRFKSGAQEAFARIIPSVRCFVGLDTTCDTKKVIAARAAVGAFIAAFGAAAFSFYLQQYKEKNQLPAAQKPLDSVFELSDKYRQNPEGELKKLQDIYESSDFNATTPENKMISGKREKLLSLQNPGFTPKRVDPNAKAKA